MLKGRDVISMMDLDRSDIEQVMEVADKVRWVAEKRTKSSILQDKILAALFFEPSTRTRLSFESAMQRLGGSVVGFASPEVSRAGDKYGESLYDTGRMVEIYSDIIAIRHPDGDAPRILAEAVDIPVISAGAGVTSTSKSGTVGEHPTQSLLDLYTIRRERGSVDGLKILFMGNVSSRTVHSLGIGLSKFRDVQAYIFASEQLGLPEPTRRHFEEVNLRFKMVSSVKEVIGELDAIYVVSIRQGLGLEKTPEEFILDLAKLRDAKQRLMVLHPLPRLDELPIEVDSSPHARYYAEAYNGLVVRMALLSLLLGKDV